MSSIKDCLAKLQPDLPNNYASSPKKKVPI